MISRRFGLVTAAIFSFALLLRGAATVRFQGITAPPNVGAAPDSAEYESITYHLASGLGYAIHPGQPTALRLPGTSVTLLPAYLAFGRSYEAARAWIVTLSAATCILIALVARELAGPAVGIVSALWLALYPGHMYYSMHFLSETIYGFWVTAAALLSLLSLDRKRSRVDVLAGGAWGMAILTRIELLIIVPAFWLLSAFWPTCRRRMQAHLTIQTACAVALVAIWITRNAVVLGTPVLSTQGGYAFWGAHNRVTFEESRFEGSWIPYARRPEVLAAEPLSGTTEIERDHEAWRYGLSAVRSHLSSVPHLEAMKLYRFISPVVDTPNKMLMWAGAVGWMVTAPFILIGLWRIATTDRPMWPWAVVLTPLVSVLVTCLVFYGSERFRDSSASLFATVAAFGAVPKSIERQSEPERGTRSTITTG